MAGSKITYILFKYMLELGTLTLGNGISRKKSWVRAALDSRFYAVSNLIQGRFDSNIKIDVSAAV